MEGPRTRPAPPGAVAPATDILLVEDDPEIGTLLSGFFRDNGLSCRIAADGRAMDRALAEAEPDAIVLDLTLPGEDGLDICRRLRGVSAVPIIILTARGQEVDRIVGLEIGADDYLGKPFNPRELLARIRAVLRRTQGAESQRPARKARAYRFAGWRFDVAARRLEDPSRVRVTLTSAEIDLLATLCTHAGETLSRERLQSLLPNRGAVNDRSIDVLVSRLRQKIENDPRDPVLIATVRLGGYRFTPAVEIE